MAQVSKLRTRHYAVMDWMLEHPDATQSEAAAALGYSQTWMSLLMSSDLFKAEFARRRAALEEYVSAQIGARLSNVAQKGLSVMERGLDPDPATGALPAPKVVKEYTDTALRALGYMDGGRGAVGTTINGPVTIDARRVDAGALQEARKLLRGPKALEAKETNEEGKQAGSLPASPQFSTG